MRQLTLVLAEVLTFWVRLLQASVPVSTAELSFMNEPLPLSRENIYVLNPAEEIHFILNLMASPAFVLLVATLEYCGALSSALP